MHNHGYIGKLPESFTESFAGAVAQNPFLSRDVAVDVFWPACGRCDEEVVRVMSKRG